MIALVIGWAGTNGRSRGPEAAHLMNADAPRISAHLIFICVLGCGKHPRWRFWRGTAPGAREQPSVSAHPRSIDDQKVINRFLKLGLREDTALTWPRQSLTGAGEFGGPGNN